MVSEPQARDAPVVDDTIAATGPWLPDTGISRAIDRVLNWLGSLFSWLWPLLVLAIVVNVVARYALASNFGQLEELQWHLYAAAFLVGLSYAVVSDTHIRVDVLYGQFAPRTKAWVELIGLVIFVAPFVYLVLRYAWPFAVAAFEIGERSPNPSGLPHRFLLKGFLFVAFVLLALAFFSRLTRVTALLFGIPRPRRVADPSEARAPWS